MSLEILGVDNILLAVGDFARAREFYGGKLGLPVKFEFGPLGIAGYRLGLEESGLLFRVEQVEESPPRSSPRLWLEVRDAKAAAEVLRAMEIQLVAEPFEVQTGWAVEVADPWGNVIGFTDYSKDPAKGRSA